MEEKPQRISWDEIWMKIAQIISNRTTCLKFKVGCVIVSSDNRHSVLGYNGSPSGAPNCCDVGCAKDKNIIKCRGCHAEANALINCHGAPQTFRGGTAYITVFPCNDCSKMLVQAGITRVVYIEDYYQNDALETFNENKIRVEQWDEKKKKTNLILPEKEEISSELRKRAIELIKVEIDYRMMESKDSSRLSDILKGYGFVSFAGMPGKNDYILHLEERAKWSRKKLYKALTSGTNDHVHLCICHKEQFEGQLVEYLDEFLIPTIARGIRDSLFQR